MTQMDPDKGGDRDVRRAATGRPGGMTGRIFATIQNTICVYLRSSAASSLRLFADCRQEGGEVLAPHRRQRVRAVAARLVG